MPPTSSVQDARLLIAGAPEEALQASADLARSRWTALWWLVPLAAAVVALVAVLLVSRVGAESERLTSGSAGRIAVLLAGPLVVAAGVAAWLAARSSRAAAAGRLPAWYGDDDHLTLRAEAAALEARRLLRDLPSPPSEPLPAALARAARAAGESPG